MRINKPLLKLILDNRLPKKYSMYLRSSEYKPVFLKMGNQAYYTGSTLEGSIKSTDEELDLLAQVIEINRIQIVTDNE